MSGNYIVAHYAIAPGKFIFTEVYGKWLDNVEDPKDYKST